MCCDWQSWNSDVKTKTRFLKRNKKWDAIFKCLVNKFDVLLHKLRGKTTRQIHKNDTKWENSWAALVLYKGMFEGLIWEK